MLRATLVFLNGKIYTLNHKNQTAQAVAIFDEKIVYVGENSEASKLVGQKTEVIDFPLTPGLVPREFQISEIA